MNASIRINRENLRYFNGHFNIGFQYVDNQSTKRQLNIYWVYICNWSQLQCFQRLIVTSLYFFSLSTSLGYWKQQKWGKRSKREELRGKYRRRGSRREMSSKIKMHSSHQHIERKCKRCRRRKKDFENRRKWKVLWKLRVEGNLWDSNYTEFPSSVSFSSPTFQSYFFALYDSVNLNSSKIT